MGTRFVAFVAICCLIAGCTSSAPPTPGEVSTPTASPAATAITSPTPTPSLTPTATSLPPPTATPSPVATQRGAVNLSADADQIGVHLDALQQIATANGGIRAAGTPGYDASVAYAASQLQSMGYDVEQQPFPFTYFNESAPVQLTVGGSSWSGPEWMHAMIYSPSGQVTAPVAAISIAGDGFAKGTAGCVAADWAGFPRGDIALIESGPCYKAYQMALAQSAGAVGVIGMYPGWVENATRRPILPQTGVTIPVIAVGAEPSAALLDAARHGGSASFAVAVETRETTIDNVVAERAGTGSGVVMLGAHLDSVLDGPGINDNGSGVATLLSIAASVALAAPSVKAIRFGFWGAEENGFLGSAAYVGSLDSSEIGQIGAYLNLDMVASPGAERIVYNDPGAPAGSAQLTQQLLDALLAAGKPGMPEDESRESDHESFAAAGVPIGGVFSGINDMSKIEVAAFGGTVGQPADPCYHMPCDTRANINLDSAVTLGDAAATVLGDLAY